MNPRAQLLPRPDVWIRISGLGSKFWGSGFRVSGFRFRVGSMVLGLRVKLDHGVLAAEGVGANLYGLGFRG